MQELPGMRGVLQPNLEFIEMGLCQVHWSEHFMAVCGRICRDGLRRDGVVGWLIMSQSLFLLGKCHY